MTFSNAQIISTLTATGITPMFYHGDKEVARKIIDVSYEGGVRVIEFTNRGPNAFEVYTDLLKYAEKYEGLIIGIGTIIDAKTTERYIKAGANFIVSPILRPEMAEVCKKYDKLWIPGAATITELVNARILGADIIKIFPASILTPGFVSSVLPVVPDLQLMATGGIEPTEESLSAWFAAGIVCVGLGSQLITKDILAKKDWHTLKHKVSDAIAIVREIRDSN
jgi:2-dehydro-3-deoxyphosphogluconate aldolase/(4S)-4-hydroxy-2-oxoglutarate aldolase